MPFFRTAFSVWALQTFLLAFVPHHLSKAGLFVGFFSFLGVIVYAMLCPTLNIPFIGSDYQKTFIHMRYGYSFYLAIAAGKLLSFVFIEIIIFRHAIVVIQPRALGTTI